MAAGLPDYVASAKPVPRTNRAPWYANTAPTYAGIMLWFVFWQAIGGGSTPGGVLSAGLPVALLGLVLAALICHFLFYLVICICPPRLFPLFRIASRVASKRCATSGYFSITLVVSDGSFSRLNKK